MHVVVVASGGVQAAGAAVVAALHRRGYSPTDERWRPGDLTVSLGVRGRVVVVAFFEQRGLVEPLLRALPSSRAAWVNIDLDTVDEAATARVDGGHLIVDDATSEAAEIVHDWCEGRVYDAGEVAGDVALALVDLDSDADRDDSGDALLQFRFTHAPLVDTPPPPPPPPPPTWRRFRAADGRRWGVRLRPDGYDVELVDDEGDTLTRSRQSVDAAADVAGLVRDQVAAGFVEEP